MTKPARLHSIEQTYHHFRLTKIVEIPELQCLLRELVHEPTGARVMHIGNEDPENLFCLSFQTLPENSNGVAHILEHTVLCGSKKFPVKDPFFSMNRRSLNTYMNALTGADFTCYPASSQVHHDFYNLLEVYIDAVFHPNLHEMSFAQEGHRLEFSTPNDPSTPLEYKGIVYNEMKGALSSSSARLAEAINASLFPDVTYGVNSGGDPSVIPSLTYEDLRNFHKKFYHPSRCLFYFYGNFPLEGHLDFIEEHALKGIEKVPPLPPIPLQPRYSAPLRKTLKYPIAPDESLQDKALIAYGWLTCHILEQEDALAMNILEIILLDTDASPLKMALLKSGLCKQVNSFIDVEINEIPWGIILKGCNGDSADTLETLILETLSEISDKPISIQTIENAIHQLEIYRSEIQGDHAPFGLSLFMRSGLLKQHGANPEQGLMIHSLFDNIRKKALANPFYFNELIKKYLLDNSHFVRIMLLPDQALGAQEADEERNKLQAIKDSLTDQAKQELVLRAEKLSAFQEQQEEEDVEILPKVTLKDVPLSSRDYALTKEKAGSFTLFHHAVFTNDIIYADLVYDLPDLNDDELFYLRLLTLILTQVGSGQRGYEENLDFIQGNTGGISAGVSLNLQAKNSAIFHPTFHLRGKALHRKAAKLFPLMKDTLLFPHLEGLKRFKEILFKHFTAMESRLSSSALKYAINLSASPLNSASKMANDLYGLNYFSKVRHLVNHFEKEGSNILSHLQALHQKVTCLENPHLILSCDAASYDELKGNKFYGLQEFETRPFLPWQDRFILESLPHQGRVIASPVAFIGKVFPTVSYSDPYAPALAASAFLFDNLVLHTKIREQGGAYGGGAVSNPMSGNFYFYSYRDPNILQTLKAFKEAIEVVRQGHFDNEDLEEAKMEMIQSLDAPVSPGSQGELAYGWWREGKNRQAFRNQLLELTCEQVSVAVEEVIAPQFDKGATVVFAGSELLEKANQEFKAEGMPQLLIEGI